MRMSAVAACVVLSAASAVPVLAAGADAATSTGTAVKAAGPSFDKPASWASKTVDAPKAAAGWDPVNVVIVPGDKDIDDTVYNHDILAALRQEKGVFWNEVGISSSPTQFVDGKCISAQTAAVQPGAEKPTDQEFSWRTVKCNNLKLVNYKAVTNHVRVYEQHATGAMFLAVSEEHFCVVGGVHPWHCITKTGYNAGRDALVAELAKLPGFDVTIRDEQEYKAGEVPQAPKGYHTPYDGKVAVVTLTPKKTVLPYQAGHWRYDDVAAGDGDGFQEPSFDASGWSVGQAGFGTTDGTCSWNNAEDVNTEWTPDTDMLVRHSLTIPAGTTSVHISGSVDNDATVYVNGKKVLYVQSGYCAPGAIDVTVPAKDLTKRTLLAVRGHDYGAATYLDVTVTADIG